MQNRAGVGNLLLRLAAFLVFMCLLLAALGFGVGIVELAIWMVAVIVGSFLIIRRHRSARLAGRSPRAL